MDETSGPRVVLLTGDSGAGKSTACARLVDLARCEGLSVGGVLAPEVLGAAGARCGIRVVHARTQEFRLLAIAKGEKGLVGGESPFAVIQGAYRFDPDALDWAVGRATADLESPLDLVVIDEIGPLELRRNRGFAPALEAIPSAACRAIVLVVRPGLARTLEERLAPLRSRIVRLVRANRDGVPERLLCEARGEG